MCLDYKDVEETKKYKSRTEMITGYKVVEKNNDGKYFPPIMKSSFKFFKKGKNKATNISTEIECDSEYEFYRTGFHSYLTREGARDLQKNLKNNFPLKPTIIKVFIDPKDVTCVGVQNSQDVIVSKYLTIKSFKGI